jgi:hypothetical protein
MGLHFNINLAFEILEIELPVLKSLGPNSSTPAISNATPNGLG